MKKRMALGIAVVSVLVLSSLGQAQAPGPAVPSAQGESAQEVSAPQLAIPAGVSWRQRLAQDGQDNYRVERQSAVGQPWRKMLTVDKWGNLLARGRLALGANPIHRLQMASSTAMEVYVNDVRALRLESGGTSPNVIGGHSANSVANSVVAATVGGGGSSSLPNRVTDGYGTVAGGQANVAGNDNAYPADAQYATIGGGHENVASKVNATISGGYSNIASGGASAIGGGAENEATGGYATIPGGHENTASGLCSFAAGCQAIADDDGAFVWADSQPYDAFSYGKDTFTVRATGGVVFVSALSAGVPSAGVYLPAGAEAWEALPSVSDRNLKREFEPVDPADVLARLADVPINTWRYIPDRPSVRHMGPTAQDFYAAFGLGEGNRTISSVDSGGVALAGVQGLYQLVQEKDARIDDLEKRVAELEELVKELARK